MQTFKMSVAAAGSVGEGWCQGHSEWLGVCREETPVAWTRVVTLEAEKGRLPDCVEVESMEACHQLPGGAQVRQGVQEDSGFLSGWVVALFSGSKGPSRSRRCGGSGVWVVSEKSF